MTDPSYAGQIVCFTAPMIGNYGVAEERSQSSRVHATAVVMREARGPEWTDWLREHGIVALTGVDTRSLVLHLRDQGAMRAAVVAGSSTVADALDAVRRQPAMAGAALVAAVSPSERYTFAADGEVRVAVVDYGIKRSLLRLVASHGAAVDVFPHDVDADTLAAYDGVLLGNGPGDPGAARRRDRHGPRAARPHPGARRVPRPPAARARHGSLDVQAPVRPPRREPPGARSPQRTRPRHVAEPRVRGRAGDGPETTHTSLYDGTVEGLAFPELRAQSSQFHPEASPGPHDGASIIGDWVEELKAVA